MKQNNQIFQSMHARTREQEKTTHTNIQQDDDRKKNFIDDAIIIESIRKLDIVPIK